MDLLTHDRLFINGESLPPLTNPSVANGNDVGRKMGMGMMSDA
jgi:hypothetical protein